MDTPRPYEEMSLPWADVQQALIRIFGALSAGVFRSLKPLLETVDLPGGHYLFHQGDAGDSMYILISGRLQVVASDEEEEQIIGEIGKGESVGEMALLSGDTRIASIVAVRDSHLLRITQDAFEEFVMHSPAVGLNLARLLIARFAKRNKRRARKLSSAALVPLHPNLDLQAMAKQIADILEPKTSVQLLDSQRLDRILGAGVSQTPFEKCDNNNKLTAWLDQQESSQDLLLYLSDRTNSEWTKRCLRQADEVFVVAAANQNAEQSRFESALHDSVQKLTQAQQTLLLLHPVGVKHPSGSADWLKSRPQVQTHWHIRKDKERDDLGRLARYLTGQTTGLVLCGGGARGFAHIGVWRALQEAGIAVDYVGATSMGAFVGGLMALDYDYDDIESINRKVALNRPSRDFHWLPVLSLLKGKTLDRVLAEHYDQYDIEDCIMPFFCVSSNLTRAHTEIHRRGNMFRAIRASGSLPGIVPPVVKDQCLLVDGGVLNNFPADIMAETGVGKIIGVDFLVQENNAVDIEEMPSNWAVIRRRYLSRKPSFKVPTMINTIMETTTLFSNYKRKQSRSITDLYITPDVSRFGFVEWRAFDEIVEIGYQEAKRVLESKGF